MIDFKNATFVKLHMVDVSTYADKISEMLCDGENIVAAYKGMRDGVVFTNKRIIAINVQGMTGSKKSYTTLPYNKIQSYSVETAGVFDIESELVLWFSNLGEVKFEFVKNSNMSQICKIISNYVL